jgi:hypothetical protein
MRIKTAGLIVALTVATVTCGSSASSAAVIYQSIPDLTGAPSLNSWCSGCGGVLQVFDSFTLASNANVESIQFDVDTIFGGPAQPITLSIYGHNSGQPSSGIFTETSTGSFVNTLNGTSIVTHPFDLSLTAGTYWISYFADDLGIPAYGSSGSLRQLYPDGTYVLRNSSSGFRLESLDVPEPTSLSLLCAGILGLLAFRRRVEKFRSPCPPDSSE